MANRIGVLETILTAGIMAVVVSLPALPAESQSRPALDCQKMAMDYAQALEKIDYKMMVRLRGQPYSKEEEAEANRQLASPEVKKFFASLIGMIRLFPKIGEIPDWVTEVRTEYQYIQGDDLIEMHGEFVLREADWIIQDLEPRGGETLTEETKAQVAGELSPVPLEGQKTIDAGFDGLIARLIAAVQGKNSKELQEIGLYPDDCGLGSSDPPEEREKVLQLLPQFPSIGPIPAPAKSFRLSLKGALDGKETEIEIGFKWPNNDLKFLIVRFQ